MVEQAEQAEQEGQEDQKIAIASPEIHLAVRENFDPDTRYLSDADIQKIIRIHYGNEQNIFRQCLLGMSLHAEEKGDMTEATRFRRRLFTLEVEHYSLLPHSSFGDSSGPLGEEGVEGEE